MHFNVVIVSPGHIEAKLQSFQNTVSFGEGQVGVPSNYIMRETLGIRCWYKMFLSTNHFLISCPFSENCVNILQRSSYLVAKASVSLATQLLRDYRECVFFSPGAVLMFSNVRRKDSEISWVLVYMGQDTIFKSIFSQFFTRQQPSKCVCKFKK